MKTKIFASAAAAALVSVFAIGATAQDSTVEQKKEGKRYEKRGDGGKRGPGGMRKGGRGKMGGHFLRGIQLTDAQKAQVQAIREANKPDPSVREEMRTLMKAKFDKTITADQSARLDVLRKTQLDHMVNVRSQIETILTAEQKALIEARKATMEAKFTERKKMREARKAAQPRAN